MPIAGGQMILSGCIIHCQVIKCLNWFTVKLSALATGLYKSSKQMHACKKEFHNLIILVACL